MDISNPLEREQASGADKGELQPTIARDHVFLFDFVQILAHRIITVLSQDECFYSSEPSYFLWLLQTEVTTVLVTSCPSPLVSSFLISLYRDGVKGVIP